MRKKKTQFARSYIYMDEFCQSFRSRTCERVPRGRGDHLHIYHHHLEENVTVYHYFHEKKNLYI